MWQTVSEKYNQYCMDNGKTRRNGEALQSKFNRMVNLKKQETNWRGILPAAGEMGKEDFQRDIFSYLCSEHWSCLRRWCRKNNSNIVGVRNTTNE